MDKKTKGLHKALFDFTAGISQRELMSLALMMYEQAKGDPIVQKHLRNVRARWISIMGHPPHSEDAPFEDTGLSEEQSAYVGGIHGALDVLGEQRLLPGLVLEKADVSNMATIFQYAGTERPQAMAKARGLLFTLCYAIANGKPYLWHTEVTKAAVSMKHPKITIHEDLMPFENMWMTFSTARGDSQMGLVDGIVLLKTSFGLLAASIMRKPSGIYYLIPTVFMNGSEWPKDYDSPMIREIADDKSVNANLDMQRVILSMLAFINSPFIDKSEETIGKQLAKKAARHAKRTHRPTPSRSVVRTIKLRKRRSNEGERSSEEKSADAKGIEYSVRWIVSGHIRNQWYGSGADKHQKPIYIAPFVKGPEDKPLKETVYEVVR